MIATPTTTLSSPDNVLESITEGTRLFGVQLDDQAATAFEGDTHDNAPALLGDLQRTIARPRLHRRHLVSPQTYIRVAVGYPTATSSTPRAQPHGAPYLVSDRRSRPRWTDPRPQRCEPRPTSRDVAHRADQTFSLMNTGEPKPSPG